MAIQVNGTTVIDNSRVLSNVTGLKTVNSTSILGSGDITAGGNIASDFEVTASARSWSTTLTTTAGAGRYIINCYLKGNGTQVTQMFLSDYSNVDDGFFAGKNFDNGTEIAGYNVWNLTNNTAMHVTGIISCSGNFTIARTAHNSVEGNLTWIKIA